ncbi:MAG: exosortase H [Acidobacteriota bacterium]
MRPFPGNERSRFLLKFFVAIVLLYVFIAVKPVNDAVIVPFTAWLSDISASVLRIGGEEARVNGTVIRTSGFAVDVRNGCNGVEAAILLVSAILAFPSAPGPKLLGIVGGFLLLETINILRIVSLVWLGAHHPQVFQMFHVAVWQTVIIVVSVAIFLLWSWKFGSKRLARST